MSRNCIITDEAKNDEHELLYDVCERRAHQFIDCHLLRIGQKYSE
jgi:hypothetical protein